MKLTGTYNGKTIELELTEEQVKALEQADKKKTGWERANYKEEYYNEYVFPLIEAGAYADDLKFKEAKYFSDRILAENICKAQNLQRKLWRRSAELCEKMDWKNSEISKYSIYYDYTNNSLCSHFHSGFRNLGEVYFDTRKHAEQVIEEFKDELIWYFTEFKSRMD